MIKELKYLIYIFTIVIFFFLTLKFYFSDTNKKNSYRSYNSIEEKIETYSNKLELLKSDTNDIVQFVDESFDNNKKVYQFWNLLKFND